MTTRGEFITGLRQLADFLTVNPDVPVPARLEVQVDAPYAASDDEQRAFVDRAALAMGAEASDPYGKGSHWEAGLYFGPIHYYALAITAAYMADHQERARLGEEALAARKQIEAEAERLLSGDRVEVHSASSHFDGLDGRVMQLDEEGGFEVALDGGVRCHFERSELEFLGRPVLAGGAS